MQPLCIYHNPRCSKSREALTILQRQGYNPIIIDYLKSPLTLRQLKTLRAYFPLKDFVRTNEKEFKELGLSLDDEEALLQAMVKFPKLMQRPIITYQGKAIIGRPPEKVLELHRL